jgi:hypothetical protein
MVAFRSWNKKEAPLLAQPFASGKRRDGLRETPAGFSASGGCLQ